MTLSDLSPVMRKAYDALTEDEKHVFLYEQETLYGEAIRGAVARVAARNFLHHAGKHVLKTQEEN